MSTTVSQAANTAAALVERRVGVVSPLMIPGTFEVRVNPPTAPSAGAAERVTHEPDRAAVDDRERLEREREGGGAPSQRRGRRQGTTAGRLWRSLLHPTALAEIWRHVRPAGA